MMRRRGVGLVGAMARTAVVAGTATAVSRRVSNRYDRDAQAQADAQTLEMQAQLQAQQAQQAQAAIAPDITTELQKLADLKAQGILNESEFQIAKQKLLTV